MTEEITRNGGFDESAFDADLDRRWRDFRLRLADHLAELHDGQPFTMFDTVSDWSGPSAHLDVVRADEGHLTLQVDTTELASSETDRAGRVALLVEHGWTADDAQAMTIDFACRHVDAAAIAAEFVLRQVWDVPDPAYLVGDDNELWETFSTPMRSGWDPTG